MQMQVVGLGSDCNEVLSFDRLAVRGGGGNSVVSEQRVATPSALTTLPMRVSTAQRMLTEIQQDMVWKVFLWEHPIRKTE